MPPTELDSEVSAELDAEVPPTELDAEVANWMVKHDVEVLMECDVDVEYAAP